LKTALGAEILSVTYGDRAPWPVAADGHGFSLVPLNADGAANPDDGRQWRASSRAGGSPGSDDPPPVVPPIRINEILTHTDPPDLDAIELFNPTSSAADLGGWYLTDDGRVPR